jgi:hypothetical protein
MTSQTREQATNVKAPTGASPPCLCPWGGRGTSEAAVSCSPHLRPCLPVLMCETASHRSCAVITVCPQQIYPKGMSLNELQECLVPPPRLPPPHPSTPGFKGSLHPEDAHLTEVRCTVCRNQVYRPVEGRSRGPRWDGEQRTSRGDL